MDNELFILDASVTINILGSGFEDRIFSALHGKWIVARAVSNETHRHPLNSARIGDLLGAFVSSGIIQRIDVPTEVSGRRYELALPPYDLDDGEAAAIAVAEHLEGTLVIDEEKGRNVAASSPACKNILSSTDVFRHPIVMHTLGTDLPIAIESSLKNSRMRVLVNDTRWIVDKIGRPQAMLYPSLRKNMARLGI
ncbi:MAG: hypothetical protein EOP84_02770 [Verrucomicrobiaceae bacterium]|nr:MAG: hypothetical protein EOP84_02770 [Verrucomicrobiaceae bacterium]